MVGEIVSWLPLIKELPVLMVYSKNTRGWDKVEAHLLSPSRVHSEDWDVRNAKLLVASDEKTVSFIRVDKVDLFTGFLSPSFLVMQRRKLWKLIETEAEIYRGHRTTQIKDKSSSLTHEPWGMVVRADLDSCILCENSDSIEYNIRWSFGHPAILLCEPNDRRRGKEVALKPRGDKGNDATNQIMITKKGEPWWEPALVGWSRVIFSLFSSSFDRENIYLSPLFSSFTI